MIESLKSLDLSLFLFLNSLHHESLNGLMTFISGQIIWIPMVVYFFFLAGKIFDKKTAFIFCLFLLLTLIACDVTSSYLLKNLTNRLRPCREIDLKPLIYNFGQKCGGRFGFVSSHASNSLALVLFSFLALDIRFKKHWPLFLLPLLVSYSRIYLGVHYPGDILGGIIVGVFWSVLFAWLFKNIQGASR